MFNPKIYTVGIILLLLSFIAGAQCPVNIGFDFGTFKNWEGYTGSISKVDGSISVPTQGIVPGRHTLIYKKDNLVDPIGKFPLVSPNGSSFIVQLGNSGVNAQAERLSYTFTIPANNPDYSLIYYYAVVFQNPGHADWEQPRFTANLYDVTDGAYSACGTYDFVAASNLPGFVQALPVGSQIYYKPWSAVTINLLGFSGKTMRLEFTTNDCSRGGHYGYAYLDINQNCTSPVSGNIYCTNTTSPVTLQAPPGFQAYYWYKDHDFSKILGTADNLYLNPAPAIGSTYGVRIVPYPGIGCEDTVYTTIKQTEPLNLYVKDTITTCNAGSIDITDSLITAGSNADFTYTYYEDAACTNDLVGPQNITKSGTYYIKATTPGGCFTVKPIVVNIFSQTGLIVTDPKPVCVPGVADITDSTVTKGSTAGATLTYWQDLAATQPLLNPKSISKSGTYYIKASGLNACSIIRPVNVSIVDLPKLFVTDIAACTQISIRAPAATAGTDPNLTLSYWLDTLATQPMTSLDSITSSGKFYIQAVNANGCSVIKPINLTVNTVPSAVITDPPAVVFPETVDLTTTFTQQQGLSYTYWHDAATTLPLANFTKIPRQSTYYIKVANPGCSVVYPVHVTISKPPDIDFSVNVFTPNGDGVNDFFRFKAPLSTKLKSFKIYASWGALIFETTDINKGWDGKYKDKPMPEGSYYWIFEALDTYTNISYTKTGNINILR